MSRYPDDTVVMVCDVDEFPHPDHVARLPDVTEPTTLPIDTYYRRANWRLLAEPEGLVVKAFPVRVDPHISELRWDRGPSLPRLDGPRGWHLSYLGFSAEDLRRKYAHFSHTEIDHPSSSAPRVLSLADRLVIDHLGRYRLPGRGLLEVQPQSSWDVLQRWFHERRPEYLDTPSRIPPSIVREWGAVLLDRVVIDDDPASARLLDPHSWREPAAWRAALDVSRRTLGVRRRAHSAAPKRASHDH